MAGKPSYEDLERSVMALTEEVVVHARAEEALRKSEERYRLLFESIDEGFCIIEVLFDDADRPVDYRFLEVNPAFERHTGIAEAVGRRIRKIAPEYEDHWFEVYGQVARTGEPVRFQRPARALGRFYDVYAFRVGEPGQRRVAVLFNDITARKRAEEALRAAKEMSEALNRIGEVLHATLSVEEIMQRLVAEGAAALGSDSVAVLMREDEGWIIRHNHNMPEELLGMRMSDEDVRHAVAAVRTGRPVAVEDALNDERFNREHMRRYNLRAVLVAPLFIEERPFGVIFFNYHGEPRSFPERDVSFARQLAATASVALENARLFSVLRRAQEELRRAHDGLDTRVRERTAELEERTDQLARLSSELSLAEQRERGRIAEMLHDHLQQLLVMARMGQGVLIDEGDEALKPDALRVYDLIDQAIKTVRSLSVELSPPNLRGGDFCGALEWLAKRMRETGFELELQCEARNVSHREELAVLLFQSVRELLLNVVKHAGVKSATVTVEARGEELRILVSDQGAGFDPAAAEKGVAEKKFGLFAIRERLGHLGGRMAIESAPGAGTAVSLIVSPEEKGAAEEG